MNKLLKTISLTCLFIFMAVSFSGCNEKKVESEFFYFPVLSHTTWSGDIVTVKNETVQFDIEFVNDKLCSILFKEPDAKKIDCGYQIIGRVLDFKNSPKELDGTWTLIESKPGKLYLEGVPDINNVKASLVLKRK